MIDTAALKKEKKRVSVLDTEAGIDCKNANPKIVPVKNARIDPPLRYSARMHAMPFPKIIPPPNAASRFDSANT